MNSICLSAYEPSWGVDQQRAVSDSALTLDNLMAAVKRRFYDVQTLTGRRSAFESNLHTVLAELTVDDQQEAVSTAAVVRVRQLTDQLPAALPMPDIAIDPDGEISLDWVVASARMLSISVGESDRLAWAWLDGSERTHGVFQFRNSLPEWMLVKLREFF